MRIAVTDSWPNLIHCAEREFLRRFAASASRVGHEAIEVITTDDINACNPDFVLCTHEFTPKLTSYPTFGVMWSPPEFYRHDAFRIRSIRSYDAYLVGSDCVRDYLDDLDFKSNIPKLKSDFRFLPVAPERNFQQRDSRKPRSLAYIGVHWEGARHDTVISTLAHTGKITAYGPQSSWSQLRSGYGGPIDFDGERLFDVLSSHGIALCIHKDEHRAADTPSMRLFEAAAAGCVIIADEIPYAKNLLGESALYIDLRAPANDVIETIQNHVAWVQANPEKATELAREAHQILNRQNSLENLISKTCAFAQNVADHKMSQAESVTRYFTPQGLPQSTPPAERAPAVLPSSIVDIVVRCGDRDIKYLKRVVRSVESQTTGCFRILLVDYKDRADIQDFARSQSTIKTQLKYLTSIDNGLRSTALWQGLSEVTAPFFAVMDDDDGLMPDHFCNLLFSAIQSPEASFFYCGVVRIEEDGEILHAPNFNGPGGKEIRECRELKFLDEFNLRRLIMTDNYIQSNAWIARKELLSGPLLKDPKLKYAEDMYLYYFLASKTEFVACNCATAYWYWRSKARDNSMFEAQSKAWEQCVQRIRLRLRDLTFPRSAAFSDILRDQHLLSGIGYSMGIAAPPSTDSTKIKKTGPIKSLLLRIPGAQAFREARRRRRRLRRLRAQSAGAV